MQQWLWYTGDFFLGSVLRLLQVLGFGYTAFALILLQSLDRLPASIDLKSFIKIHPEIFESF